MSDNNSEKEPKLSRGLKIFILAGTVFIIGFGIIYYAIHSGDPEYYRTQIEPDSTLADKELIVKQDTVKRDTAAADSANKEEEEQAKKVYNSIRGNVRHKVNNDDDQESADQTDETTDADEASKETTTPAEPEKNTTTPSNNKSEAAPKVEKIE